MFSRGSGALDVYGNGGGVSKNKISAVIITRNEETNIVEAIKSVSFADQVVVCDTSSDDKTVQLARRAGAEVHDIPFEGFGAAKNRALEFCTCDWILSIDADERVSPELVKSIENAVSLDNGPDCYAVNRLSFFLGKAIRHSGWFPDYVTRLFRKGHRFSENRVHESLQAPRNVEKLDGLLLHYSYHSLDQYMMKLNYYSTLNAIDMSRNGRKGSAADLLFRPPAAFFKMFVAKMGFLDGMTGFILAVLSSYHVFVKYAKLRRIVSESSL